MGNFKKGALFGGIVGAALVWLNTSKKGKAYRDQLLEHAGSVYADIEAKVKESDTMEHLTKNKYVSMVKEVVDKYAIQNGLAESTKDAIIRLVSSQWGAVNKKAKTSKRKAKK